MKEPNIIDGIKYIKERFEISEREESVANFRRLSLEKGAMWPASLRVMSGSFRSEGLLAFFVDSDILRLEESSYFNATAMRMVFHADKKYPSDGGGDYLLYPLLSNNKEIIHWHSQFHVGNCIYTKKQLDCLNSEKLAFFSTQPRLALQGDWENLVQRSELVLKSPPKKHKSYDVDQKFYIALSKGDSVAMEQAIIELISPKYNRVRNKEIHWGFEEKLFSAWGVILLKIAQYHGYELNIDNPWIPQEWLKIRENQTYNLPYDFMEQFNIFSPLINLDKDDVTSARLSPKPLDVSPLSFDEVIKIYDIK